MFGALLRMLVSWSPRMVAQRVGLSVGGCSGVG